MIASYPEFKRLRKKGLTVEKQHLIIVLKRTIEGGRDAFLG